jgi:hypothetical protein
LVALNEIVSQRLFPALNRKILLHDAILRDFISPLATILPFSRMMQR